MTGALEIVGSIDAERNRVNERHVDAHAVLERAQLLEALALLERGRPQPDEALERRAAKSIDADVMVERPFSVGGRGAREQQGAQACLLYTSDAADE